MIRLDPRTVELDDHEMIASEMFDRLLDDGMGIHDAADTVAARYPNLDPAFIAYLRDEDIRQECDSP
jgi:hypothetical protein